MVANFSHCLTYVKVRIEKLVVLAGVPIRESRELLGNGLEETNNDTNRGGFHIVAEFVHGRDIL